jgi:hypothetical protein
MAIALLHKPLLSVALICCAGVSNAQMVFCDIFLKGKHMEIGINNNGAFGTSVDAPLGYHNNITDTLYNDCTVMSTQLVQGLGFVCDPNLTSWSAYYGDFVMAGNPHEGWAISDDLDSATAYSYNYYTGTSGFTGALTGGTVSYSAAGSTLKGNWAGTFHSSLNVVQTTTIDTANLYLKVHVGFYNTSIIPDSFYYLRTVNPHNEAVTTSTYNTKAKIEHQLPNPDGLVVVSASGITDTNAYLALGTRDPRAKCFIVKDSTLPGPGSFASIWAGEPTHYNYSDTLTGDHGIGIIYKIGVGAGDSSFLDYGYSFKGGIIDTVLDTALHSTGSGPLSIHIKTPQRINIFPNPGTDLVYITGLKDGENIFVYNLPGSEIKPSITSTGNGSYNMSIADFVPGTYIFLVRDSFGKVVSGHTIVKN